MIGKQVDYLKDLFDKKIKKYKYTGKYYYSYATKANYSSETILEAIKHIDSIETSSRNDIDIISYLYDNKYIDKNYYCFWLNMYNFLTIFSLSHISTTNFWISPIFGFGFDWIFLFTEST